MQELYLEYVSIRVTPSMHAELQVYANELGLLVSRAARQLIEDGLAKRKVKLSASTKGCVAKK